MKFGHTANPRHTANSGQAANPAYAVKLGHVAKLGPLIILIWLLTACAASPPQDDMITIPAGPFLMASRTEGWRPDKLKKVLLDGFLIDRTEVTIGAYARFLDATGYRPPMVQEPWAQPYNWLDGQPPEGYLDHPVTLINWFDAVAYCTWAGKRLPTNAEWEKAAFGTDGRRFPWGNAWQPLRCNGGRRESPWYDISDGYETTAPVGSYPRGRSPYGVEDMFGNAWEWTSDYSGTEQGIRLESFHHRDGMIYNPVGPTRGIFRVVRGGSFFFILSGGRDSERQFMLPESRRKTTGFRCVKAIVE